MISIRRLHLDPEQASFQTTVIKKHQEHERTVTSILVLGKYSGAAYCEG